MMPLLKVMLRKLILCLAVLQLGAGMPASATHAERPAGAETEIQALLASLERQRANAIRRGDTATLRHLMDRQYHHVESRGRVRSKTELLTAIEREDLRFRVYEVESMQVQVLDGGSAALVTGIFRSQQAGAAAKPFRARFVRVWLNQPDGWKNTFHQTTEIRPAQDDCSCN